jgi:hypothetical protein
MLLRNKTNLFQTDLKFKTRQVKEKVGSKKIRWLQSRWRQCCSPTAAVASPLQMRQVRFPYQLTNTSTSTRLVGAVLVQTTVTPVKLYLQQPLPET